jgi:transcriptional regulator MraZ
VDMSNHQPDRELPIGACEPEEFVSNSGKECCKVGQGGLISAAFQPRQGCVLFTGKFELTIDAKQRLAVPARIRQMLDRERAGAALYVIPGANGAVWLWPERTFEQICGEVAPSLTPASEQMDFDESAFPEADRLELDSAGRIRLPQDLLDGAGLGGRVVLLGMRHHLELWDPGVWAERSREKAADRPQLAQRARSVNGGDRRP